MTLFFVRCLEPAGDLLEQGQSFAEGDGAARYPFGERFAFHELHNEEPLVVRHLDAVDGGDVGMIERRQQTRFALEAKRRARRRPRNLGEGL